MTTLDPGARLVFTQGLAFNPRSTAFFASKPAASMTDGFDVLVQLVMAAMTTEPFFNATGWPLICAAAVFSGPPNACAKLLLTCGNSTRSWGLLGPATE